MAVGIYQWLNLNRFVLTADSKNDLGQANDSRSPFFVFRSPKVGVLLLHGLTGSPHSLSGLAQYLSDQNLTVYAPLLAGHESLEKLAASTIGDWKKSAEDAIQYLSEIVEQIYVVGASFGGNLAFYLSNSYPEKIAGIISIGTPIRVRRQNFYKFALHTLGHFKKYQKKNTIFYRPEYNGSSVGTYSVLPVKSIRGLFSFIQQITIPNVARVKHPALIVQSIKDPIVDPISARYIYSNLSSEYKTLFWLRKKVHSLDQLPANEENRQVFESIYKFIAK